MLAGNFSAYSNQIYDPASTTGSFAAGNLSRTPFAGNIIPANRFSTMWNAIAANKPFLPPQAGTGSVTNTGPSGNIVASGTGNYFNLTNQFRVDHSLNNKMRTDAFSYSTGNQHQPQNNVNIGYKPYDQYQTLQYTVQNHAALSFTYTISPTLISETKVGMYRRTGNYQPLTGEDYTYAIAKTVPNLPANVYLNPINFGMTQGIQRQLAARRRHVEGQREQQPPVQPGLHQESRARMPSSSGMNGCGMNYINHDISNPRLTLGFGQSNGSGGLGQI